MMGSEPYKPEEISSLLRQAEVLLGQGMSMDDAIRQHLGISEARYYNGEQSMAKTGDQLRRFKELEKERETERLRRAIFDLMLDKQILAEAARGNF